MTEAQNEMKFKFKNKNKKRAFKFSELVLGAVIFIFCFSFFASATENEIKDELKSELNIPIYNELESNGGLSNELSYDNPPLLSNSL